MEQELGNEWTDAVHPEDVQHCSEVFKRSFDARQSFQIQYRLRRADGHYRWVLCHGAPRFEAGVFAGYTGTCMDIDLLRELQDNRFEKQSVESLWVLMRGLEHDFSNLMCSILATVELAESLMADGEVPGREVQNIKIVATRTLEMVRELMIFGTNEKGNFETVNVPQLVKETIGMLRTSITKRAVLKTKLPKHLPAVWANPTRIRQIAMNLVLNASEALGDRGGVIQVKASLVNEGEAANVACATLPGDQYLRLEVSDTGCGMTEEQKARIFDPYFTTKQNGHGLGLTVVSGVVHSLGGTINVTSTPGKGTTFEVLLPCLQSRAGRTPKARAAAS